MRKIPNTLFSKKSIEKFCVDVNLNSKQKSAAKKWKELLDGGELKIETQNEAAFIEIILNDLLGYPKPWEGLQQKVDYMDISFPPSPNRGIVFELKGRGKELDRHQHYDKAEQDTPILQTMNYINKNPGYEFGICTNYEEFVLITKNDGLSKCYRFNFPPKGQKLTEEEIIEFVGIFSKKRIVDLGLIGKISYESIIEQKDLTNDFYRLFHETRLMLIKSFEDKKLIHRNESIKFAQMFLNRLIFVFFGQDNDLVTSGLFTKEILKILEAGNIKEGTTKIFDHIQTIFTWMDKGSNEIDNRLGFDGELFKDTLDRNAFFYDVRKPEFYEKITKKTKFKKKPKITNPEVKRIVESYRGKLSPIITNLLIMDSYDFRSQISVNILGHIFEQSIGDLEELRSEEVSKKKKEGVFYTPEYITEHICTNTIIPYLSKEGNTDVHNLVLEYSENIDELEKKFTKIKILDPACGSGAFLIKAIDVLLDISREIQEFKEEKGEYSTGGQYTFDKWNEDVKIRGIIQNNIYGVDINSESIEITKLSLFLKIATKNKKLFSLSERIKKGNSLVDDKSVDEHAFGWEDEFPEVMKFGKFDIIIGNPPYIRVQLLDHKHIDWFKENYKKTAYRRVDVSGLFFELGKKLLKENGLLCFIISNQFLVTDYGRKTREFLLKNFKILNIVDFGWLPVFEGAITYVGIFNLMNSNPSNFQCLKIREEDLGRPISLDKSFDVEIDNLSNEPWILWDKPTLKLLGKLKQFPTIKDIGNAGTGLFTGLDEILLLNKKKLDTLGLEKEIVLPVLTGSDPSRYGYLKPSEFVIYPYKLVEDKTIILDKGEFQNKFSKAYKYLLDHKNQLLKRKDSRKTFEDKKDWFGLTRFGKLDIFKREKIVTPGEVRDNKFAIDTTGSGFLNARVFCIIIDDKKYDLRYVLGMLNSKIVEFFLHKTSPLKQKGYFAYASKFLNDVPVPLADKPIQELVSKKVSEIIEINKQLQEQKDEFLDLLTINHSIKITRDLNHFYELDFDKFVKELDKQDKKLSLDKQLEWRKFFNSSKTKILGYQDRRKRIDNEIEEMFYSVYDLNKNETKIVLKN